MKLIKYHPRERLNPFSLLRSFHDDLDRHFSDALFSGYDVSNGIVPNIDLREDDDQVTVAVELPGLKKDDFELRVENNVLILKGEKKEETEKQEGDYSYRERRYGSFHREVSLPTTADPEKVSANLADGILTVTIPKKDEAKPRQITVNVN